MIICLINFIGAAILVVLLNQCIAPIHLPASRIDSSPRLKEILTWRDKGSVYSQARQFDGFEYRETLTKASLGDSKALGSLFEYTKNGSQMGEGAETHIEVLGELLRQWGDTQYGRVLNEQPTEVIRSVAQTLNEFWGYAGWPRSKYPITQRLCTRSSQEAESGSRE